MTPVALRNVRTFPPPHFSSSLCMSVSFSSLTTNQLPMLLCLQVGHLPTPPKFYIL